MRLIFIHKLFKHSTKHIFMVEILKYLTLEDSELSLENTVNENKSKLDGVKSQLKDLPSKTKKKCTLTKNLELTCLFFLNKYEGKYDFSYGIIRQDECIAEETYETIDDLANAVKTSLNEGEVFGKYGSYGIKIIPLFYTIEKSVILTEQEAKKISNIVGEQINRQDVEGLTKEEIERFVEIY